jgi:hypothetical protein
MRTAWSDMRNRLIAGADNSDNFDVEHKLSTQSVNVVICAALRCAARCVLSSHNLTDKTPRMGQQDLTAWSVHTCC